MKRLFAAICFAAMASVAFALPPDEGGEPVCEWAMFDDNGTILNTGADGAAGNLTMTAGAELSEDVPTVNTGGQALRISGEDPEAAAESVAEFDPLAGAEKFTIMAWVRRESVSSASNQSARIFSDYDGSGGVEFLFGGAPGYLQFRVNDKQVWTTAGWIMPNNYSWHHVAVVYDSTRPATNLATRNVHFYVDGIQKDDGSTMDDVPTANAVCAAVGNTSTDRAASSLLAGSIDNVLVFRGWAPEPSGRGNVNREIETWMLTDDADRLPPDEGGDEDEGEHGVPPVILEDVIVQQIGTERQYEDLPEGLIFVDTLSGELFFVNEENPHGRMVCTFHGFPNWHNFTNTVRLNGNKLELNAYYSLMAESHALSARYGTNTVWSVVGEEGGDLAGLTVALVDDSTLMIACNVVGPDVSLQVCTNLVEANPWRPATNAEVVAQTDMATTWRVHVMTNPEFYRVLHHGPSVAEGFHVFPTLHAHGGIEAGGTMVTNFDILATTNDVNAVSDELAAHKSASNPHHITAAGIGALTEETDAVALAALGTHTARTDNPHGVTLVQAYDADPDGAGDELGISISPGDGISELKGFSHRISFEEGLAEGNFDFDTRPTYAGTNLATTAEVASVSASVSAVSGRVSAIEADYVQAADIEDFATTQAVASVERRIAQLQNDNCTLFWATSNGGLHPSQNSYLLPTNFPTPKLTLYVFQRVGSNIAIDIPAWNPGRDVQIDVIAPRVPRSSDNALNFLLIGNPVYTHSSYAGVYFSYSYSLDAGRWFTVSWTMSSAQTATGNAAPDGSQYTTDGTYLTDAPATVEEWLALHPAWATP